MLRAMIILLVAIGTVAGAPAGLNQSKKKPEAKKPGPPAFVGSWRLSWGQGQGDAIFSADGGFWCLWVGKQWLGSWRLENGRLVVTEGEVPDRPDEVPRQPITWSVELDASGRAGICTHEGRRFRFELRPPQAGDADDPGRE